VAPLRLSAPLWVELRFVALLVPSPQAAVEAEGAGRHSLASLVPNPQAVAEAEEEGRRLREPMLAAVDLEASVVVLDHWQRVRVGASSWLLRPWRVRPRFVEPRRHQLVGLRLPNRVHLRPPLGA
jgi:hypothetical protein